jgi:hypothetical protein
MNLNMYTHYDKLKTIKTMPTVPASTFGLYTHYDKLKTIKTVYISKL